MLVKPTSSATIVGPLSQRHHTKNEANDQTNSLKVLSAEDWQFRQDYLAYFRPSCRPFSLVAVSAPAALKHLRMPTFVESGRAMVAPSRHTAHWYRHGGKSVRSGLVTIAGRDRVQKADYGAMSRVDRLGFRTPRDEVGNGSRGWTLLPGDTNWCSLDAPLAVNVCVCVRGTSVLSSRTAFPSNGLFIIVNSSTVAERRDLLARSVSQSERAGREGGQGPTRQPSPPSNSRPPPSPAQSPILAVALLYLRRPRRTLLSHILYWKKPPLRLLRPESRPVPLSDPHTTGHLPRRPLPTLPLLPPALFHSPTAAYAGVNWAPPAVTFVAAVVAISLSEL
jgi:hypothetical protein